MSENKEEETGIMVLKKTLNMVHNWLIDDLEKLENPKHIEAYLRFENILSSVGKPPYSVTEKEITMMKMMREAGYSIREISFVYQRSKATVHAYV